MEWTIRLPSTRYTSEASADIRECSLYSDRFHWSTRVHCLVESFPTSLQTSLVSWTSYLQSTSLPPSCYLLSLALQLQLLGRSSPLLSCMVSSQVPVRFLLVYGVDEYNSWHACQYSLFVHHLSLEWPGIQARLGMFLRCSFWRLSAHPIIFSVRFGISWFLVGFGALMGNPVTGALLGETYDWSKALLWCGVSIVVHWFMNDMS